MLRPILSWVVISTSLFGGLAFGAAPITSVSVNSGTAPAPNLMSNLTPEQRIDRLENQVQYLSNESAQVQSLNAQISLLRGQLEDVHHQVTLMQKQLTALTPAPAAPSVNATVNVTPSGTASPPTKTAHTSATGTIAVATAATAASTASTTTVSPLEQKAFDKANRFLTQKQYEEATQSFSAFLKKYPKSTLAPDAHFWLGDLYLAQGEPDKASAQYKIVSVNKTATKRPDAMVKLGTILLAYGDNVHAKALFQGVLKEYPKSPAAKQATIRLKGI
jgi:tol-pal system protein YbgF